MTALRKSCLVAFGCGGLAGLSLPPIGFLPALFFLAVPVISTLRAERVRDQMLIFGMAGWGWFTLSLYWVGHSLLVKGGLFLLLLPVPVLGLPFLLCVFWACAAGLVMKFLSSRPARIAGLALFWPMAEMARSWLFTGFPWNVIGHAFIDHLPAAQMAAFIGQNGLNFMAALLVLCGVAVFLKSYKTGLILISPFLICLALAMVRLNDSETQDMLKQDAVIRLVQPNIDQAEKWNRQARPEHIARMVRLISEGERPASLTILPEAAIAGFWRDDAQIAQLMASALPDNNGVLVTGILSSDETNHYYNSAYFLHQSGGILGRYHKQHLVPFGEYIPFRSLPFVDALAGRGEFHPGGPAEMIYIKPFGLIRMLICYEVIFPDFTAGDSHRPDTILSISNDAWFGQTAGPHQHFAQAQLRAIEEAVPVYRAANTGISGGFDGYGRLLGKTKLGEETALDLPFVKPAVPSFYARHRWLGVISLITGLAGIIIWLEFFSQKRNNRNFLNDNNIR